jgi:hypothetical protein
MHLFLFIYQVVNCKKDFNHKPLNYSSKESFNYYQGIICQFFWISLSIFYDFLLLSSNLVDYLDFYSIS